MALASRGLRDMDQGQEVLNDADELARLRLQARNVHVKSLLLAAMLVGLVLLLPTRG